MSSDVPEDLYLIFTVTSNSCFMFEYLLEEASSFDIEVISAIYSTNQTILHIKADSK